MSRFYQTAPGQFSDFMFKPPWELIQAVMAKEEKSYEDLLKETSLYGENINFKYINEEGEAKRAQEKQKYYKDKIDSFTQRLKDSTGGDWKKIQPEIRDFSRELNTDMTSGDIYKMGQSYNNLAQWEKDNEDLKKKKPLEYSILKKKQIENWANEGGSPKNILSLNPYINGPQEAMLEAAKNTKEIKDTLISKGYEYKYSGNTSERIQNVMMDVIQTFDNYELYSNQQSSVFGKEGYKSKPLITIMDKSGKQISYEDYKKLELEEGKKYLPKGKTEKDFTEDELREIGADNLKGQYTQTINPEHPLYPTFKQGIDQFANWGLDDVSMTEEAKYNLRINEYNAKKRIDAHYDNLNNPITNTDRTTYNDNNKHLDYTNKQKLEVTEKVSEKMFKDMNISYNKGTTKVKNINGVDVDAVTINGNKLTYIGADNKKYYVLTTSSDYIKRIAIINYLDETISTKINGLDEKKDKSKIEFWENFYNEHISELYAMDDNITKISWQPFFISQGITDPKAQKSIIDNTNKDLSSLQDVQLKDLRISISNSNGEYSFIKVLNKKGKSPSTFNDIMYNFEDYEHNFKNTSVKKSTNSNNKNDITADKAKKMLQGTKEKSKVDFSFVPNSLQPITYYDTDDENYHTEGWSVKILVNGVMLDAHIDAKDYNLYNINR